jgi:hypothetical protein
VTRYRDKEMVENIQGVTTTPTEWEAILLCTRRQ